MAIFETTSYAQMRRCRMAHLHGEMIDEQLGDAGDGAQVGGYVHAVRPDLTCWPLRWTITIEHYPVPGRAMALAG